MCMHKQSLSPWQCDKNDTLVWFAVGGDLGWELELPDGSKVEEDLSAICPCFGIIWPLRYPFIKKRVAIISMNPHRICSSVVKCWINRTFVHREGLLRPDLELPPFQRYTNFLTDPAALFEEKLPLKSGHIKQALNPSAWLHSPSC